MEHDELPWSDRTDRWGRYATWVIIGLTVLMVLGNLIRYAVS